MAAVSPKVTATGKVVIIGGGMAGISAAQRLTAAGWTDVKIVEARDRPGGRMWTQRLGPNIIELGANWIHGSEGNPIYKLAEDHNLLKNTARLQTFNARYRLRGDTFMPGGQVIDREVVQEFLHMYEELIEECCKFFLEKKTPHHPDESVGNYLEQEFPKRLNQSTDNDDVKRLKMALFKQHLKQETFINGCHSMKEVGLQYFGEHVCFAGGNINLPDGYDTVFGVLLKDILSGCILYNKQVKCVLWDQVEADTNSSSAECHPRHAVSIVCEDGEILKADHVIITVPLGFLKKHASTFLQPPLPEKKLRSIAKMGFGVVDKIFLEYEKPFWEAGSPGFQLVCREDETEPSCPEEWYKKLYIFYVDPKAPNFVFCWLSGEEALHMETLPEEEVAHKIVEVLRRFTGNDEIPLPQRLVRSRWGSDPLTCGSYSFMAVGASGEDIDTIAEPLYSPHTGEPVVQFAGEATHRLYQSTVHAAYLSGQREADRLIHLCRP
ncbi:peroxisomal N(1)-acetyl-spermine/spermidine oxidase-like [Branchiostoma floridae x Branchiostoma belcheri]